MIGLLADAHGNCYAFDKAISLLDKLGAENFIFLGDALGYFPNNGVLETIASLGKRIKCVLGNHEDMIIRKSFQNKFEPVYQHKRIYKSLTENQLQIIQAWPTSLKIKTKAGKVLCVHGSPNNEIYEYVYPDTDLTVHSISENFVFMAHTHRPFLRQHGNTTYVNVGSCGLPRDHGCLASAALFDERTGSIRILRFNIKNQLDQASALSQDIHPSILALQQRNPQTYIGEIIE